MQNESDILPGELRRAKEFHTHLGPYLVVGMKMGRVVVEKFGPQRFATKILSHTGTVPPLSCIIDGLQLTTPCTVGNGGIQISQDGEARITAFKEQKILHISLKNEVKAEIDTASNPHTQEEIALRIWRMAPEELLEIRETSKS